ncbi:MFS transporter [Nitrosomonas nitrosa]|uniref:MFS transporter n=1 Tax=Nitrosomonas nitrosa TaxID=52442 RepID=UPI0023F6E6A1|nr:MFS transporter [Nitrosomonas nitrosa]
MYKHQYIAYRFFANTAFYVPILILHIEKKLGDPSLAFMLVGIYGITIFATEIPTGLIADSIGSRNALIAGSFLSASAAYMFGVSTSFIAFTVGQMTLALALSLQSGADSAYLYELCSQNELYYKQVEGSSTGAKYLGLCISSVTGSILYAFNPRFPFMLSVLASLISGFCLFKLPLNDPNTGNGKERFNFTFRKAVIQLRSNRYLVFLLVYASFFLSALSLIYWSYQPYLRSIGIGVELFGTVFAVAFLASAVGARTANKINQVLGYRKALICLGLMIGITGSLMGLVSTSFGLLFPIITQFFTGYASPTLRILLQKESQPSTRATLLSIESMLQRLVMSGGVSSMGLLIREMGLSTTMMSLGSLLLLILPISSFLIKKEIKS